MNLRVTLALLAFFAVHPSPEIDLSGYKLDEC